MGSTIQVILNRSTINLFNIKLQPLLNNSCVSSSTEGVKADVIDAGALVFKVFTQKIPGQAAWKHSSWHDLAFAIFEIMCSPV